MSSPLTVKRRRLNESASTLKKPFVSPFKTSKSHCTPREENKTAANQNLQYQPSILAHTIQAVPSQTSKLHVSNLPRATPVKSTPIRKQHLTSSSKRTDPAELAVQKALTSLELQIRAIRNDIDTLSQAQKLQSSTIDADLEDLAQKWRLASQAVAEELFGSVKERVCRMGGVQAWRESEKKTFERRNGLGEFAEPVEEDDGTEDCEFDSQGEELPEAEQEFRKKEKRRVRKEMKDAADFDEPHQEDRADMVKKNVWEEKSGEDDAFTIDMMLRSLNIELDVIGYDKEGQRWVA